MVMYSSGVSRQPVAALSQSNVGTLFAPMKRPNMHIPAPLAKLMNLLHAAAIWDFSGVALYLPALV